jgi:hypothetical protein
MVEEEDSVAEAVVEDSPAVRLAVDSPAAAVRAVRGNRRPFRGFQMTTYSVI